MCVLIWKNTVSNCDIFEKYLGKLKIKQSESFEEQPNQQTSGENELINNQNESIDKTI